MTKFNSLLVVFALTVGGCVSTSQPISPDSLNHYRDTLVELSVKSIEAITVEYEWSYRSFKEHVKTGDTTKPQPFMLAFDEPITGKPDAYKWCWESCDSVAGGSEATLFREIEKSKGILTKVNQAMIDYANFLVQFNNANESSKASLDAAANEIGVATKSISSRLGIDLDKDKLGAFATIGSSVVQQLLAKKQREGMAAVMNDFQSGVQYFGTLGSEAMDNSAVGIKAEYQTESKPISRAILVEKDGEKRLALVEKLMKLSERTSAQLDSLKNISAAYESLGSAHEELMEALKNGKFANLGELVGHIEMISSVSQAFKKPDSEPKP